ncbi:MAG: hypothetical protein K1060chlam5_01224 [Candidatus Anoxychlamydiales bacterium]|nr:hypothetical protein [Candidatus Anoxychlamydiales bacterium]
MAVATNLHHINVLEPSAIDRKKFIEQTSKIELISKKINDCVITSERLLNLAHYLALALGGSFGFSCGAGLISTLPFAIFSSAVIIGISFTSLILRDIKINKTFTYFLNSFKNLPNQSKLSKRAKREFEIIFNKKVDIDDTLDNKKMIKELKKMNNYQRLMSMKVIKIWIDFMKNCNTLNFQMNAIGPVIKEKITLSENDLLQFVYFIRTQSNKKS